MKTLLKFGIAAIIVIVILNSLGLLDSKFSKQVDNATDNIKQKISTVKIGDTPLFELSPKELYTQVSTLTEGITFKKQESGSYSFSSKQVMGEYSPADSKMTLKFNCTDKNAIKQVEALISLLQKKKYSFPKDFFKGSNTMVNLDAKVVSKKLSVSFSK